MNQLPVKSDRHTPVRRRQIQLFPALLCSALCWFSGAALAATTPVATTQAPASQASMSQVRTSQAEPAANEHSWQVLFDGSNLDAWRTFKQTKLHPNWQIVDGALTLTAAGGGDILTKEQYQDFELQLEWQISEGGNSGVFILADETGPYIYSHAPEIQILDNERHSDNKLDNHRSGSLYDMIAAPAASQKAAGAWNQLTIRLFKGHLQVWQNKLQTVDVQIGSPQWQQLVSNSKFANWQGFASATAGHIGLQDHGDKVAFKHIRIRKL